MHTPSLRGAKEGVKSLFNGAKSRARSVSGKLASVSRGSKTHDEEEEGTHVARLDTMFFASGDRQVALDKT
jgi:hypothetical protein